MAQFFVAVPSWGFDLGILILRVALGVCFVVHGLGKLGIVGTGNLRGFSDWLQSLGFPLPTLQARMAMATELVGGFFLMIGFLFRPTCFLLFVTMMVAAFAGHRGSGYLITNQPPGLEYALNLGIVVLALTIFGPGMWSIDFLLFGLNN